jgi:hypothetical protein
MQYSLTVSLATLRAARTHSADKDVRYYLCGVYLDTKAGKVVATDGHRMLVATARGVKLDAAPVIIPNELLDAALKQFGGDYARGKPLGAVDVSITVGANPPSASGARSLTIATPTGQVQGVAIVGEFPDWRRVVPKADEAEPFAPAVLNWQYVTDACEALTIAANIGKAKAGQHATRVQQRGEFPAIVCSSNPNVMALVMPLRNDMDGNAPRVACRMAHEDALGYNAETAERVNLEAAAAVSAAA